MNAYIHEKELEEVKASLARWKDNLPNDVSEVDFYTVAKKVHNLCVQNSKNAKKLLSDFSIGDISLYLVENKMAEAVIVVDKEQNYQVKCFNNATYHEIERDLLPTSHIRGNGMKHIIII